MTTVSAPAGKALERGKALSQAVGGARRGHSAGDDTRPARIKATKATR